MKQAIYFIMALVLLSGAMATDECEGITEVFDIPCRVTINYDLPNSCNTYESKIYKGDTLEETLTLRDYGEYCQFDFNHTEADTYYYNVTTGDTGSITVGVEMQQIYNLGVYGLYLGVVFILIVFMHVFKKDAGTPIVYGGIAAAFSFIMVAVLLSGFDIFHGVTFIVDVNYYLVALTAGIGLYCGMIAFTFYEDMQQPA